MEYAAGVAIRPRGTSPVVGVLHHSLRIGVKGFHPINESVAWMEDQNLLLSCMYPKAESVNIAAV